MVMELPGETQDVYAKVIWYEYYKIVIYLT